jgi:hypothetical protein
MKVSKPWCTPQSLYPTEETEQRTFCAWLDVWSICYMHVPNEGKRSLVAGKRLKGVGLKPGFPDLIIFDHPPAKPEAPGVIIEMKTKNPRSKLSPQQKSWLTNLTRRGWITSVCNGAEAAIEFMVSLGYGGWRT